MKKAIRHTFLTQRFYLCLLGIIFLFLFSYVWSVLLVPVFILLIIFILLIVLDVFFQFSKKQGIAATRRTTEKWSNSDENPVDILITSNYSRDMEATVIDELPVQFQERDFELGLRLKANSSETISYNVRPVERGEYAYGDINVFTKTQLGLVERRHRCGKQQVIPTYPSFLQLRKYELMAFSNRLRDLGIKKIRKLGHTMEFEQIKEYVRGDDVRNLNWKATAKRRELMINQFQDERSQNVYSIIDKGRAMKMPFEGLKLLDYALNATLVISSIALKKGDKCGMLTFSDNVENTVKAEKRSSQMNRILETLYNVATSFRESDFSRLYVQLKRSLTQRSLLLLYTNFETMDALHRQLPYLQAIAKSHRLVVIFFENTELERLLTDDPADMQEIFDHTIAQKFMHEKKMIVTELNKYGIQTILTKPKDLSVNTINKYLEIKARGMI